MHGDRQHHDFNQRVVDQYEQELRRFLEWRLRRSGIDANDVAQETFLRLLRVDNTELIRKPRAYLYQIAANVARELALKEHEYPVNFSAQRLDPESVAASPATGIERVEHASSLEALLEGLPPTQQAALILLKRDGKTYREIAEELGLSVNTVKKYLFRAMAHCRRQGWR